MVAGALGDRIGAKKSLHMFSQFCDFPADKLARQRRMSFDLSVE
jgi:hypothetical protein